MSEKKLKTRIQQKTDTKANWDKAANFVPLKGEYIYYSDINRVKVGDGVKKLSELPFVTSINDIANGFNLNSQSDIVWNYSGHQDNWTNVYLPWNYGGLHWGKPATAFNASSNRIDLFASEKDQESLDLIIRFGGDYTDAIKIVHDLSNIGNTSPALTLSADGWITCNGITVKNSWSENVFTGNTKINGSLSVGGDINAGADLNVSGKLKVGGKAPITSVTAGSGISIETSDDGTVKIACSYSDGDMETY